MDRPSTETRTSGGVLQTASDFSYDGAQGPGLAPTKGARTTSRRWLGSEGRWVSQQYSYDSFGNQISHTDETQRTLTRQYDTTHHLFEISTTNAASESLEMTWDPICGVPIQTTDVNEQVTSHAVDALCRTASSVAPLGAFEITSHLDFGDPNAQRIRTEYPPPVSGGTNGSITHYVDGLGRVYRTVKQGPTPGASIIESTAYDSRGNVASQTAPYYQGEPSVSTSITYDGLNRPLSLTYPDGTSVERSYGPWTQQSTDPHGHSAIVTFNSQGNEVSRRHFANAIWLETVLSYDALGRLVGMTDPAGNTWSWEFDTLGRNTTKIDPDAGTWMYQYDDAGRVLGHTDAKGQPTQYAYDSAGRLNTKTNASGTMTIARSEARAGYFNSGRETSWTLGGSILTSDFDALGRVVRQARTIDGVEYTMTRSYDSGGRLKTVQYPDGDSIGTGTTLIEYDNAGRLRAIPGLVSEIAYDAAGRPTTQTNVNGTVTTRSYSPERGFLTHIGTTGPGGTLQDVAYSHDDGGLVSGVTSPIVGESWSYVYDELHRVSSATNLTPPVNGQTFTYDNYTGNVTFNSRIGAYSYPSPGSSRPHAPSEIAGGALSYDANGNLVLGRGREIQWNANNQPEQVTSQAITTTFGYGALGERVKKSTSSETTIYPFGDDYEISGGVSTKYVVVPGLGVVARRVGAGPAAVTHWLHTDHLGSVSLASDAAGTEVQRRTYRPFGERIGDTTSLEISRGWVGERTDESTQLAYLHARYYDPATGLFLSPDPLHPTEPGVGPNRYSYAGNSPINVKDPSGLSWGMCMEITFNISTNSSATVMVTTTCVTMGHTNTNGPLSHLTVQRGIEAQRTAQQLQNSPPRPQTVEPMNPLLTSLEALKVLLDFGTGKAKEHQDLSKEQVAEMKDSPGVRNARDFYIDGGCRNVTGYNASFGVLGGAAPGRSQGGPGNSYLVGQDGQFIMTPGGAVFNPSLITHPTRQIIGSYNVDITNNGNGSSTFDITSVMSLTSAGLHLLPEIPNGRPGGNTLIHGSWREATPCP